jgi:hypothetical protein
VRPRSFRVRPADNDELGPIEAFALNPSAAIAGQIGAIEPLRDDAFEAMQSRRLDGACERRAIPGDESMTWANDELSTIARSRRGAKA